MKREFLVQYVMEDVKVNKIMSENEVVDLENMSDVYPIENMRVYDINEIGIVKPLKYKGWQPMCLIEFEDEEGNVIIRGYGEDH